MTIDVVLVGLGNIGFRHLQGLMRSEHSFRLHGVDIVPDNIERARAEASKRSDIIFVGHSKMSDLPSAASVGVVATTANGRLELMEALLDHCRLPQTILEKVVFQTRASFEHAKELVADAGTRAWVNCPRRMWPFYRSLRAGIRSDIPFTVRFESRHLGLACNAVHFIDLFQFLSNASDVALSGGQIASVVASKRPGFFECYGDIEVTSSSGSRLQIVCREDGADELVTRWTYHDGREIDFRESVGIFADPAGGVAIDLGRPPFQSELTGRLLDGLLANGGSTLPDLTESAKAHSILFDALEGPFSAAGHDVSRGLPIT
ncbi:MAG: hypothetical protein KF723_01975 [Rhizobiaceae bacterium]|nr:hypothetical protein [Rhizobiaceae bacterium]